MARAGAKPKSSLRSLQKTLTGIKGLDEITRGGLPQGRPTLVCGGAGSGKTLFGIEFLVRGATEFNERGVFMAFEETADELAKNVASLGFDVGKLVASKKLLIDHVRVERSEIQETGEYDLEGLFIRLGHAIDQIGAKRVVLDTVETLFSGLPNELILRSELRRLFRWLKDKGMTTIVTAEQGTGTLTRQGLEEYVSDCVIFLDHRVNNQVSTRRFRVVKYRGSMHGTNEFPFLIDEEGITVLPITSLGLKHDVTRERVSSGIPRLDKMLGGKGYFRGSTILVSGTAGTGKTSIAGSFVNAVCKRGQRALFFAFEESASQIIRNLASIGVNLKPCYDKGLLIIHSERPTIFGLEAHLATFHKLITDFKPSAVVIDPVSNLNIAGNMPDVKAMLTRLIDYLKLNRITAMLTALSNPVESLEQTDVGISSLADTWLLLRDIELGGERNRGMYILKSRGMAHSNQIREFLLTNHGIDLLDVYAGSSGVLTGSARASQEAREKEEELMLHGDIELKQSILERKRKAMEAQIATIRAGFESEEAELKKLMQQNKLRQQRVAQDRKRMAQIRKAD